jgi:hypothetical protein
MNDLTGRVMRSSDGAAGRPLFERRQAKRSKLRDAHGKLAWESAGEQIICDVSVSDISGSGAAVLAGQAPAAGNPVQLSLTSRSSLMAPIQAQTVAIGDDPSGKQVVRLKFDSWVPLESYIEQYRERRLWQRYPVREKRALLVWLENDVETKAQGELLNIGGGGAAVMSEVSPPFDTPIGFELAAFVPRIDPVESRLVVVSPDPSGRSVVRLCFNSPCPVRLFEVAVNGMSDS